MKRIPIARSVMVAFAAGAALGIASTPSVASGPGDPNGYFICHRDAVVLCQDGTIDRSRYDSFEECVAAETANCVAIGDLRPSASHAAAKDLWDRKTALPTPV